MASSRQSARAEGISWIATPAFAMIAGQGLPGRGQSRKLKVSRCRDQCGQSYRISATLPGSGNIVVEAMAKVAVITGSNGLIGQATCRRLAQSGHVAVGIDVGAGGSRQLAALPMRSERPLADGQSLPRRRGVHLCRCCRQYSCGWNVEEKAQTIAEINPSSSASPYRPPGSFRLRPSLPQHTRDRRSHRDCRLN